MEKEPKYALIGHAPYIKAYPYYKSEPPRWQAPAGPKPPVTKYRVDLGAFVGIHPLNMGFSRRKPVKIFAILGLENWSRPKRDFAQREFQKMTNVAFLTAGYSVVTFVTSLKPAGLL